MKLKSIPNAGVVLTQTQAQPDDVLYLSGKELADLLYSIPYETLKLVVDNYGHKEPGQ